MQYECKQCGKPMSVVQYYINPVCSDCCKKNHEKVMGKFKQKSMDISKQKGVKK